MKNIITLTEGNQLHVLPVVNILRIDSAGSYTIFYMKNGKDYVCCKNLGAVEKHLTKFTTLADIFFRVHRSHVVNLNEVKAFERAPRGGKIILSDNAAVSIATRRKAQLLRILNRIKR